MEAVILYPISDCFADYPDFYSKALMHRDIMRSYLNDSHWMWHVDEIACARENVENARSFIFSYHCSKYFRKDRELLNQINSIYLYLSDLLIKVYERESIIDCI
jgi:hypothetical protein